MSAIPSRISQQAALYPLSESDAVLRISQIRANTRELSLGLEALARVALRVPGLHRIRIVANSPPTLAGRLEWSSPNPAAQSGSAMAPVTANGRTWGRLHLYFEPRIETVESPLRFARFLGQQLAGLLNHYDIEGKLELQVARRDRVAKRLETRKAVHRAKGILARVHGTGDREALLLLLNYARQSRRSLDHLANSVILGDTSFRRPQFRPIGVQSSSRQGLASQPLTR